MKISRGGVKPRGGNATLRGAEVARLVKLKFVTQILITSQSRVPWLPKATLRDLRDVKLRMYSVYALEGQKDCNLYIGFTENLKERIVAHNSGSV